MNLLCRIFDRKGLYIEMLSPVLPKNLIRVYSCGATKVHINDTAEHFSGINRA